VLRLVPSLYQVFDVMAVERHFASMEVFDGPIADPDPWVSAVARTMRSHVLLNFGWQHAEAEADFGRALATFRGLGERWGAAFALSSLASLLSWRGECAAAAAHLAEGITLVAELGIVEDQVTLRVKLAQMQWLLGERDAAREQVAEAQRLAHRIGLPETRYWVSFAAAELARHDGDLARAHERLAEALGTAQQVASPQARALVAGVRGYLAADAGDLAAARGHHAVALREAVDSFDSPVIAQVLVGVADLAARAGDAPRAATLLGASEAVRGAPDLSLIDAIRVAAAAREALGDGGFDRAYRQGLAMDLTTVTDLAGELTADPVTPGA
jgi:ATP/maltotriose-dependent transcriptional regulator MalT